jgi:opacity protein-like surface antigen
MTKATQAGLGVGATPLGRLFLAGTSLMVLAGSALAADLPVVKAPPAVVASWAGFYLGVHGGYGWKQDDFSTPAFFAFPTTAQINGIRSTGAVYGAQAGYNWQFGRVVTGLEIDFSAADIKGSNGVSGTFVVPGAATISSSDTLGENVRYLGSVRARLGWLPTDKVLLYGTAGLAWERLDRTEVETQNITQLGGTSTGLFFNRNPTDKFGWVAGVGAEVMLGSPNWIGRLEYLHYDLGQVATASTQIATGNPSIISTAGSQTIEVVRAGVSYKFGEPARIASVAYAKAPVAAPLSSWSGFYLGAHGGYGWANDPTSLPLSVVLNGTIGTPGSIDGTKSKGWVGGGQLGHNWQYDRVVTGLEIDLSAADIKGNTNTGMNVGTPGNAFSLSFDEKVKYLGTMRGRLGWLPTDNVLLYGTAGLAWERLERGENDLTVQPAGTTNTRFVNPFDRFGWVAGVGGEVKLGSSNWIGRLEYLHYDFGRINQDASISVTQPGTPTFTAALTAGRQTIDLLRAGVSYKFGPEFAAAATPAMITKAPRMAAPLQSWAGFYLGAHGGYGWKDNDFSTNFAIFGAATFVGGIKSTGWLGGGQAGYNWQYTSVVAGLEIDGSATGIKGSSLPATAPGNLTETLSDNVKYLGTARGRLGWTPASSWLLYGTGGLAWERVHRSLVDATVFPGNSVVSTSETPRDHFGWVAGAGVERFIGMSNWIARLEYLHYDFGTVESTVAQTSNAPGNQTFTDKGGRQTIEVVRAAVSYKFTP